MHVGEIPDSELVTMLNKRCGVAESLAKMMVAVMRELHRSRKNANILAGKYGFITPQRFISMGGEAPWNPVHRLQNARDPS